MIDHIEIIEVDAFFVVGISVRTINSNGQSHKDLMVLWERFVSENVYAKAPNRISNDYYCVYSDYESDYTGYYTAVICYRVNSLTDVPKELTGIIVPAAKYCVYALSGECPRNVLDAWQQIWVSSLQRRYTVDYDKYTPNGPNFSDTLASVFVSVK